MLSDTQITNFTLGIGAFVFIVSAHIILLHALSAVLRLRPVGEFRKRGFVFEVAFVLQVIAGLFAISFVTNLMWGGFIRGMGIVPSYRNAVFYSLENYTSLGLTQVQVDPEWRTLAPLISLSGVFCLGWTTAWSFRASALGQGHASGQAPSRQ